MEEDKYKTTFIYKIESLDDSNYIYIGHTTDYIKRKEQHIRGIKDNKNNLKIYETIRQNGGINNFKMRVLEIAECNSHHEALERENYYYNIFNANLNSSRPLKVEKIINNIKRTKQNMIKKNLDPYVNNILLCNKNDETSYYGKINHIIKNEIYYFKDIDKNNEEKFNNHENIKSLIDERTMIKYNNLKNILDDDINDIYDNTLNDFYNIENEKIINNKNLIIKIMITKTIKILNIDIRYEKFIMVREFDKIIENILNSDFYFELIYFFNNIDNNEIISFDKTNKNINKNIKCALKRILNYIGLEIKSVDKNNNTKKNDFYIIYTDLFKTERPVNIFIKNNLVKSKYKKFYDTNNVKVYKYNKNYCCYNEIHMNGRNIKFSEKIDEENEKIKPLMISNKEYNEIKNKIYINNNIFKIPKKYSYIINFEKIFNDNGNIEIIIKKLENNDYDDEKYDETISYIDDEEEYNESTSDKEYNDEDYV